MFDEVRFVDFNKLKKHPDEFITTPDPIINPNS